MIRAYVIRDHKIESEGGAGETDIPAASLWLDACQPTLEERRHIELTFGVELPSHGDETSSRLYVKDRALYMTATAMSQSDTPFSENEPITFILTHAALVTLRRRELQPVNSSALRLMSLPGVVGPEHVLLGIVEHAVNGVADALEKAALDLDAQAQVAFPSDKPDAKQRRSVGSDELQGVLGILGKCEDVSIRARESLASLKRLLQFFARAREDQMSENTEPKSLTARIGALSRDITSLSEHATFELSKASFLLSAVLGLINIAQNRIVKLFSVVSVVFLGPIFVASAFGMNFKNMPGLQWSYGYPLSLALILMAGVLPYAYFKRKGWL